jgi:hypothetical protein
MRMTTIVTSLPVPLCAPLARASRVQFAARVIVVAVTARHVRFQPTDAIAPLPALVESLLVELSVVSLLSVHCNNNAEGKPFTVAAACNRAASNMRSSA